MKLGPDLADIAAGPTHEGALKAAAASRAGNGALEFRTAAARHIADAAGVGCAIQIGNCRRAGTAGEILALRVVAKGHVLLTAGVRDVCRHMAGIGCRAGQG